MKKNRAVIRWAALLCAFALLATAPHALAIESWDLTDAEFHAVEIIFQVFDANDALEQEELLLQAVQVAPDSAFFWLECANLLSELNNEGTLTAAIEVILLRAKSVAAGELFDQALRSLADHYLQTKGLDAAKAFVEEELEKAPDNLALQIMLARVHYLCDDIDAALSMLDDILARAPQSLEAAKLQALLLIKYRRWNEALEAYDMIENLFPDSPDALNGRYVAYAATGQFHLAVRAIDEELFYTGNELLWLERLNIRVHRLFDPVAALPEAEALIKAYPDETDAYIAKFQVQLQLRQYDGAIDTARAIARIDEPLSDVLEGVVLMIAQRWDEAKAIMLPALAYQGLQGWWSDAVFLYLEGYDDVDSARDALIRSFAAPNNEYDSFLRHGDLNAHIGNRLEAARCYYRAEQHAAHNAGGMKMLVLTLTEAGRRVEAAKYLQTMEERYPGWFETMFCRVYFEQTFGAPEEALIAFYALKENFPYPASAVLVPLEAQLLLSAGNEKGEKMIEEWLNRIDPDALTADDWLQYAQALLYTGDTVKIDDALSMAASHIEKIDPARVNQIRQLQARVFVLRAETLRHSGDMKGFVDWIEKACELGVTLIADTLTKPDGNPYPSDEYDELYRQYGPDPEPWDVTIFPTRLN